MPRPPTTRLARQSLLGHILEVARGWLKHVRAEMIHLKLAGTSMTWLELVGANVYLAKTYRSLKETWVKLVGASQRLG